MIGIVGGIGSYAGLDLMRKICDLSGARSDQEHLPMSMISIPHKIPDRSKFLLREIDGNPADGIAEVVHTLFAAGARVIGIPCNTAHAPQIFEKVKTSLPPGCTLVNLVEEVGRYIVEHHRRVSRVGVLATNGTYFSNIYDDVLKRFGLHVILPDIEIQTGLIHPAVYDPGFGIKSFSSPVTQKATADLRAGISHLKEKSVEIIVLGCTEIPLAIQAPGDDDCPFVDATSVLARALIRESKSAIC